MESIGSGSTPGNRWRFTAGKAGLATVAVLAGMAAAVPSGALASNGWYLTVRPTQITPGGSVNIKTTAHRSCPLTIRVGGTNYHYRLPRGGEKFTFTPSTPLGRTPVTVHCKGLVATIRLNVIAPPATPAPPPATNPAPPPASPPSTPAPAATQTQVTVANVCGLNPALGPIHYTTADGYPTAYWTDGSGSKLTLEAFSDDGDNKVDIAAVFGADGQSIAYFAHCDWSSWLTVAQYEAAQAQQGVSSSQASSLSYLLQEQTDNAIFQEEQEWFQPAAGWQVCPGDAPNMCNYEPVY